MLIDGERVKWGIEDWQGCDGNEPDDVTLECEFANGETEYVRLAVSPDFVPEEKPQFGEAAGGCDGHPAYVAVSIVVIDRTSLAECSEGCVPDRIRKCREPNVMLESQDYKWFEEHYAEHGTGKDD